MGEFNGMTVNLPAQEKREPTKVESNLTWCNYCWKNTPTKDCTDCTICGLSKTSENIVAQDACEMFND